MLLMFTVDLRHTCVCVVLGYRSVQLLNEYSEELEIASLLVRIILTYPKVTSPIELLAATVDFSARSFLLQLY